MDQPGLTFLQLIIIISEMKHPIFNPIAIFIFWHSCW